MKALVSLALIPLILSVANAAPAPDPAISQDNANLHVRGGLRNLLDAAGVEKKCHVAFLGGSITQNAGGHTAMVPTWLEGRFPDTEFTVTNAGISSTCSTSGAFRMASQVFAKTPVDLLVVEFAVNDDQDAAHARRECIRGIEGIIRAVGRDHPGCDVLMVHFVNSPMLEQIGRGEVPLSIAAHEAVAERYGVISVNVAAEVAAAVKAGRYTWEDYGGTHPARFGYEVASNMITAAIELGLAKAKPTGVESRPLAAALDVESYDEGVFVSPDQAVCDARWRSGKVGRDLLPLGAIRSQYLEYDVLRGDVPGAELKLEFEGQGVGAFVLAGPDAGIVETSVDGTPFLPRDLYHHYSGGLNYPRSVIFATGLAAGKHILTLRIADGKNAKSKGTSASILFFEINR